MFKRIVGWFVLVPLCAVLIVFALANRQPIIVNFNPFASAPASGPTTLELPLYFVLFGALLLGVLLGGTAAWFAQGPHRRDEKHFRRETERLHRELEVARRSPGTSALVDDFPEPNRT